MPEPEPTGGENWRDTLPEDIRDDPSLEPIKDIPNLAKSYINAQRMVGADKVVIPGDDATDEERAQFFQKLGRPENPDGYGITKPSDLPEGMPYDEEYVKEFVAQAHTLGLTTNQAMGLWKWGMERDVNRFQTTVQEMEQARQEAETALRKEWGKAYDERMAGIKFLVDKFGGDEVRKVFDSTGIGNNPALAKFLADIANEFSEDTLRGMGEPRFGTKSPAEAKKEIQELWADKKFLDAYWNPKHPGNKAAKERMQGLYALAYPEEEK